MSFEVFLFHLNKGRIVGKKKKKTTKKSLNLKSQISYYLLCQYNLYFLFLGLHLHLSVSILL